MEDCVLDIPVSEWNDVLIVLFSWLRPRDMLPFRLVCKEWYGTSNSRMVLDALTEWSLPLTYRKNIYPRSDTFKSTAPYLFMHKDERKRWTHEHVLMGLMESGNLNRETAEEAVKDVPILRARAIDILLVDSLTNNEYGVSEPVVRSHPRSQVCSLHARFYLFPCYCVSSELLYLLVLFERVDYLSMLFPVPDSEKGSLNNALRHVIGLLCEFQSIKVYEWVCYNFKGNIAKPVYEYAIKNASKTLLYLFKHMRTGLLRITRNFINEAQTVEERAKYKKSELIIMGM